MKLIRAIVRPEREMQVVQALEKVGEFALTKYPVTGRGRQGGLQSGVLHYSEVVKVMFMLVVPDERANVAVTTISHAAYTGYLGDGRIFISNVESAIRLRTGEIQIDSAKTTETR